MALTLARERDDVVRLDLHGRLDWDEFERCQEQLRAEIAQSGTVRLLVMLEGFTGWEPGAPWNDLTFYVAHGDAIARIAIVGPEQWRSLMLMFAAADLRKASVEYFLPGMAVEARAWLSS